MKKEKIKTYAMTPLGYAKLMYEEKQEKLGRINGVVGLAVILGMFGIGFLSKELFIVILTGKGIKVVTNYMVG